MADRIRIGSKLTLLRGLALNGLLAIAALGMLVTALTRSAEPTTDRVQWAVMGVACLGGLVYSLWSSQIIEYVDLSDWVTIKTPFGVRSLRWDEIMALQMIHVQGRNGDVQDYICVRPAHGRQVRLRVNPYQKTEIIEFMRRTGRADKVI